MMKQQLIDILSTFKYPVFLQGSINSEDAYPDSFFTFWNFSTPESAFYDDNAGAAVWGFWIYFYSTDPLKVQSVPEQARQALKAAGWTPDGRPQDTITDVVTHTGAMFTVYFLENYSEEENT